MQDGQAGSGCARQPSKQLTHVRLQLSKQEPGADVPDKLGVSWTRPLVCNGTHASQQEDLLVCG
jgi:hypothetical protein